MIVPTLLGLVGLAAGFLLIRHIPTCPPQARVDTGTSLSIIIPARNEEHNLPRLLSSIRQSSLCPTEILVVDDDSSDNTSAVARSLGASVVIPPTKAAGWTGKCWACHQGAIQAAGELLLFLDADTYFRPHGLDRIIAHWQRQGDPRAVLSVLPFHLLGSGYEQLSLFFNVLMAAGAGGFSGLAKPRLFGQSLLIGRELYFRAGGHSAVADAVLENLRWADRLREKDGRILCMGGRGTLCMRMFPEGFRQMSESWDKAFVQGAADSGRLVVALAVVWISALWSVALLLAIPHSYGRFDIGIVLLLLAAQVGWIARQIGRYNVLSCLLYTVPLAYFCAVFGLSAVRRGLGRRAVWRGREV